MHNFSLCTYILQENLVSNTREKNGSFFVIEREQSSMSSHKSSKSLGDIINKKPLSLIISKLDIKALPLCSVAEEDYTEHWCSSMGQDAQDEAKNPEESEKRAPDPETSWRGAESGRERGKPGKKQQGLLEVRRFGGAGEGARREEGITALLLGLLHLPVFQLEGAACIRAPVLHSGTLLCAHCHQEPPLLFLTSHCQGELGKKKVWETLKMKITGPSGGFLVGEGKLTHGT